MIKKICVKSLLLLAVCLHASVQAADHMPSVETESWQFEYGNDLFFGKDNKISGGWSFQRQSAVAESWQALANVPDFVREKGSLIINTSDPSLFYRSGIALSQLIQTPQDQTRSDLVTDDVPYAGILTLQASWYAFNDDLFRGFEVTAGVVGPPALAEQSQKAFHHFINNAEPQGWHNQLNTEPLLNVSYVHKQKIARWGPESDPFFDIALNGHAGMGNLYTQISGAIEMRFGINMPKGFLYVADPVGLRMYYKASLKPSNPDKGAIYTTLVLRGSAFAHNILLDGNTFQHSHRVKKEPLIGVAIWGLHYERQNWGLSFRLVNSSDNVDINRIPSPVKQERLGLLAVEWRY